MKQWMMFLLLVLFIPSGGWTSSDAGTTAFNFLKLGAGARQMAMGNSGVAVPGDVNSAAYNPATLGDLTQQEAGFMHSQWLEDITHQYAAYAYPHADWGTFGLNFNYATFGEIKGYDRFNRRTADVKASNTAIGLSYARNFKSGFGVGLTSRYIRENLSVITASAYNFDLGALYRVPGDAWWSNFDLGLSLRNLGGQVSYLSASSPQPFQIDAGFSYSEWKKSLIGTFEVHKPNDSGLYFSFGGELNIRKFIIFRAGYKTNSDIGKGLTLGAGLRIWEDALQIDYSLMPFDDFGAVQRVGLIYRFGGLAENSFRKGLRYMKAGKYAEAILEFDKVLAQKPSHTLAIRYMRRCADALRKEDIP